jgi:hypothetical protein
MSEPGDRADAYGAPDGAPLQSGILTSPADGMLTRAIARTLEAPCDERALLF